ncbi:hypothetical protein RUM43_005764 [Polyplax serrata]|uniref:Uncharacterized protein n=1 Tax=Polyplax serrata TaxID=468196 RepID=A0AAN8RUX4_POLSC
MYKQRVTGVGISVAPNTWTGRKLTCRKAHITGSCAPPKSPPAPIESAHAELSIFHVRKCLSPPFAIVDDITFRI